MIEKLFENPNEVIDVCVSLTLEYLNGHKSEWTKKKNKVPIPITEEVVKEDIRSFLYSTPSIGKQTTVPDELVSEILELQFGYKIEDRKKIQKQYNQQKQVEQKIIGKFLELYILKHSFEHGWVQSGDCISGTDMIKKNKNGTWFKLQIKNSDNTANSSSAGFVSDKAVTWKRRNSKKGTQFWHNFPDANVKENLSEEGFKEFIKIHLSPN